MFEIFGMKLHRGMNIDKLYGVASAVCRSIESPARMTMTDGFVHAFEYDDLDYTTRLIFIFHNSNVRSVSINYFLKYTINRTRLNGPQEFYINKYDFMYCYLINGVRVDEKIIVKNGLDGLISGELIVN